MCTTKIWFHEDNFKVIKTYSTLILLVLLHFWSFLPMGHSFWPIFLNLPSLQLHRQKFDRNDIAKYFAPQSLKVYHCGKFSMAIKIQPQKKNSMALVMGVWWSLVSLALFCWIQAQYFEIGQGGLIQASGPRQDSKGKGSFGFFLG